MKTLVGLLLCVCAVYADSGYADVTYGGYLDLKSPHKGCHYVGQYLKHPKDECKYLLCDYGNEPWKQNGKILLFAREMRCANGLSVGYGYNHGYDNPCTTPNKKCFVKPKYEKPTYKHVDTKAVYHSYDGHHDGYGKNQGYDSYNSYDNGYDNHVQGYGKHDKHDQGYGKHDQGYGKHNQGYDSYNKGYDNKGYDNKGYDNHNAGYDNHNKGYDNHNTGYDNKNSYDNKHTGYEYQSYGGGYGN